MIFDFKLPLIGPHMTSATIECLYPSPGTPLKTGSKLLDLSVDLSSAFSQDCPPISYFRIITRENLVLREFHIAPGQMCNVGDLIAVFSTTTDEALDQPVQRGIRSATAGIMHHGGMWTGSTYG